MRNPLLIAIRLPDPLAWKIRFLPRASLADCLSRLISVALSLLALILLVDPSDEIMHLKAVVFAALILLWLARKLLFRLTLPPMSLLLPVSFFAVILPSIALLVGLCHPDVSVESGMGLLKSFLFLFLLLVVVDEHIALDEKVIRWSLVVAGITILVFACSILSPAVFDAIYLFSLDRHNMMLSEREVGFGMFYYKTSTILIFPLAYYLSKPGFRKGLMSLMYAFALLLSGSRANIIGAFLVALYYLSRFVRRKVGPAFSLVLAALVLGAFAVGVINLWSGERNAMSDRIRYLHFSSYAEYFTSHPWSLVIGDGLGVGLHSQAASIPDYDYEMHRGSELTYIELVRVFGIPAAGLIGLGLLGPFYKRGRGKQHVFLAYGIYLLIAGTNPLLLSSTGMLVVMMAYSATNALPANSALPHSASRFPLSDCNTEN